MQEMCNSISTSFYESVWMRMSSQNSVQNLLKTQKRKNLIFNTFCCHVDNLLEMHFTNTLFYAQQRHTHRYQEIIIII